jgi:dCTP deaminase
MGLKPDHWIRKMAIEKHMIEPFTDSQVREGVISFGVSSYGYDIRVADEFKIFTSVNSAIVNPKHFDTRSMVDFKGRCASSLRIPLPWGARSNISASRGMC